MAEGAFDIGLTPGKYIFVILVIIVFTFSYGYSISRYQEVNFDTGSLNANLLMRSVFYSKECFAYEENNRVFFGELDSKKISNDRLKNCISEKHLVKVTFENSGKTVYNNEVAYNNNKGFCKFEKVSCYSNKQILFVLDEDKKILDTAYIEVIENI